jgi:hypothetical protein
VAHGATFRFWGENKPADKKKNFNASDAASQDARRQSSGSSLVLRTADKARQGLTVAGLGEAGVRKKLRGHRPQLQ